MPSRSWFKHSVAHQIITREDGPCKVGGKERSLRKQCIALSGQEPGYLAWDLTLQRALLLAGHGRHPIWVMEDMEDISIGNTASSVTLPGQPCKFNMSAIPNLELGFGF